MRALKIEVHPYLHQKPTNAVLIPHTLILFDLSMTSTSVLPQLEAGEGAASYNPNTFAYQSRSDREASGLPAFPAAEDWLNIFYDSIGSFKKTALSDTSVTDVEEKAAAFAAGYQAKLDALSSTEIGSKASINCLELCRLRFEVDSFIFKHNCYY
jgi:hypothetical protein